MSREGAVLGCGVVLLAVGIATHEWVVTGLWADPEFLATWERRLAFRIVSWGGLGLGLLCVLARAAIARRLVPLLAVGVTVSAVLGLFLAADLFLGWRLMSPERMGEEHAQIHDPDPRLGWVPRPGAAERHRLDGNFDVLYRIDDEGYRAIPQSGPFERRVWIHGDSYTFGYGVENDEAWPAVLANRYLGPRQRVTNAGVNGYGLIQMYGRLQDAAAELRPGDLVVFAPTSGDLQRNLHDFQHVSLLLFGSGAEDLRFPRFENGELVGVPIDEPWNRVRALFLHALVSEGLFRFVNRAITAPASVREGQEILAATRRLCAERGVDFVLLMLPKLKEIRRGRYEADPAGLDFVDLQRFFPGDEEALAGLRFPTNAHWNAAGHAIAARAVAEALGGLR